MQHAFLKTLLHGGGNFAHVFVALAEIHVVADADDLGHEQSCSPSRAPFRRGRSAFLINPNRPAQAQRVRRRRKAEARARGVVPGRWKLPARCRTRRGQLARRVQFRQALRDERERADVVVGLSHVSRKSLP